MGRTIQSELNYRQAQDALRGLIDNLDLTNRERSGLEPEIGGLQNLLDKLDRLVVQIAVFGMVGRGKSSLLNALLGQSVFETGAVHGVTQSVQAAQWTVQREPLDASRRKPGGQQKDATQHDVCRVTLPGGGNSRVELIDTPGIDEVDGETRERLARQVAQQADLILFVVSSDMTTVEYEALSQLRQASKPILLVFNKVDQYPEADRLAIYHKIRDQRVRQLVSPNEIVMAAASPLVTTAVRHPDGRIVTQRRVGTPDVEALKLKILEILHQEGKSLVALNTMLYADHVSDRILQRKLEIRDRSANQLIWNGVMTKAVAIALNPIAVADLVSGVVIDIAIILALSKLYGLPMTQQGAVSLLQKIALGAGGITASELIATFGLGSLKSLLGAATPVTGGLTTAPYLAVALAQAGVAGVSSYAIAQVTKEYLANGAAWGSDGIKPVVTRILASLDETSIMNRIKDELWAKLDVQRRNSNRTGTEG
jgi:GTPase